MQKITLVASPKELKKIAAFIEYAADEIIRMGDKYDHIRLSDEDHSFESSPHFVIAGES